MTRFLCGSNVARVPVPREEVPPDIRDRFSRWRTIYRVLQPVALRHLGHTIYVFTDALTDFASIPVLLAPISSRVGNESDSPSVIHDMFYRCAIALAQQQGMTLAEFREWADIVFREALLANGCARWRAVVYFKFVRWFGWWRFEERAITNPEGLVCIYGP